jgi:hypothetical protein
MTRLLQCDACLNTYDTALSTSDVDAQPLGSWSGVWGVGAVEKKPMDWLRVAVALGVTL